MTRILLTGASGRMGRKIAELAPKNDCVIAAGVDIAAFETSFPVYTELSSVREEADVLVDFSHHAALDSILAYAVPRKLPVIICTTGHTPEELERLWKASESIPVFRSGNMSIGINLLTALVKKAAAVLEGFDIEVLEMHHNQKLDAPSGTALMLAEAANEGRGGDNEFVYSRHDRRETRPEKEIGVSSLRGGTVVGQHEVIFAGTSEVVTLSHTAESRDVFAVGALKAAAFMAGKPAGKYDMNDVIGDIF